jgi:hypothetical protein
MQRFRFARTLIACTFAAAAAVASAAGPLVSTDAGARDAQGISDVQRARLAEKLQLVDRIVQLAERSEGTTGLSPERRSWLRESLYMMPLDTVRSLGAPSGFAATRDAIMAAQKIALKALGDPGSDLVYRPITPCRYIDTRVTGVPVGSSPYSVDLGVTGATYGGSGGCNPVVASGVANADDFAAISMNVAIVTPQFAPGFIGARPAGSSQVTALVNWFQTGANVQASNAAVVTTKQGAGDEIEFFGTPTHLVVDVMGVFTRPDATALDCQSPSPGQAGLGTANVPPGSAFTDLFQAPACAAGYAAVALGCEYGPVAPAGLALTSVGVPDPATGFVACSWFNGSASTLDKSNFHIHTRCCRVPGR